MSSDEGNSGSTGVDDFSQLNTPNALFGEPKGFDAGRDGFGSGSKAAGAGFSAPSLGNIDNNTTGITAATADAIGGGSGRPSVSDGNLFGLGSRSVRKGLENLADAVGDLRGGSTTSRDIANMEDQYGYYTPIDELDSPHGAGWPSIEGTQENYANFKAYQDAINNLIDDPEGTEGDPEVTFLGDLKNAVDEAEPTLMSNFFGGRYDAEYDPKNGWQSVNNTTLKDVATSPAAFTLASFGVGAPLGAGTVAKKGFDLASDNLAEKTNKYGSPVMDNTRDYDDDDNSVLNSLFGVPSGETFGGGVPFTDAERQQAFGDGGQGDRPPQRRAYFPSGQPAQELAPTDPRAYTNPRFKRNSHSWGPGSGYTFNMADIEEIF